MLDHSTRIPNINAFQKVLDHSTRIPNINTFQKMLDHSTRIPNINAFQKMLDHSTRTPNKIWVDNSYSNSFERWLKDHDIEMYSIHNEVKFVSSENVIRLGCFITIPK